MAIDFRITGLSLNIVQPLFALSDAELTAQGCRRCVADAKPGYPCRVSLQDAEVGERLILLHYQHHSVSTPYRAGGPIYVREQAEEAQLERNQVPEVIRTRLLSLRAYDSQGMLIDADVIEGREVERHIERFFANAAAYLHVHNARPGCYSCRVDRAP